MANRLLLSWCSIQTLILLRSFLPNPMLLKRPLTACSMMTTLTIPTASAFPALLLSTQIPPISSKNLPQTLVNPFACSPPITPVLPHPRCASLRLISVRQFVVASLLNRRVLPMKSESPSMEMIRSASSNTSTTSRSFRQRPTLSAHCSPTPILRSFCTPREKSKT